MPYAAPAAPSYARTVRGTGPGLLLAHGAGGSVEANYGPVLGELTASRTAVGVDYPGTGATPRATAPLELDALVDELTAAADAEGLDRFAVSGYSLGTAVAVRLAARHPERVTALVLTAPFARADNHLRLAATLWRELFETDRDRLALALVPLALSPAALASLGPEELAATLKGTAQTAPAGTPEHTSLVERLDVRADLARITAPTLVVSTTGDRLVPPSLHREVAAGIPGAQLSEIATGHLPFAEAPAAWARLLTEFLAAHGA
ncbi:alpha/beta fold hydrolase [Actinomycetota bacterium Odt1-20B]